MKIAFFDFDGTITQKDSFVPFIKLATSRTRLVSGWIKLFPKIISYKMAKYPASKIRSEICHHSFKGKKKEDILDMGLQYSKNILPSYIRKNAITEINNHKKAGTKIVVVSAALDVYLKFWCRDLNLDLICTTLEEKNGYLTGKYVNGDCTGDEKVKRIKAKYNLSNYEEIYSYGDTIEDIDMLSIADRKIFRWNEISSVSEIKENGDHVHIG